MAKKLIKIDAGQLKHFCEFWSEEYVPDEYGSGSVQFIPVLSTRCNRTIKNKTSQSQTQAGSFDFYQIWEFIIRGRSGFAPKKDMIIYSDGSIYAIKGVAPLADNPKYTLVVTGTINDDNHALWEIINK